MYHGPVLHWAMEGLCLQDLCARWKQVSAHGLEWTESYIGLVVDLGWLRVGARRRPKICMGHGNFDSNSAIWATHPSRLRFGF